MSSTKQTVLVTGASGFVASHIVAELLSKGYAVKGTVRPARLESLTSTVSAKFPDFTPVSIADIVNDDLSDVLKGVDAVIHTASPLPTKASPDKVIEGAIDGTVNVIKQAVDAGIKNIVLTSSFAAVSDPDHSANYTGTTFTASNWGETTREEVLKESGNKNPFWTYCATKALAEKAAWEYVEKHPDVNFSTILPPFIYGPFREEFPTPKVTDISTDGFIYGLIRGEAGHALPAQGSPYFCDVRDVAKAHVAALSIPQVPSSGLKRKRYLISGGDFTWQQAAKYLEETRPELKGRLASSEEVYEYPGRLSIIDVGPAKKDLGIEFIEWKQTVTDALESLLKAEKTWV